jgi:hypothetical protein
MGLYSMSKETKNASELAMIMERARQRLDCAEVTAVAVRSGEIGWRVITIFRDGRVLASFKEIDEIASELRAKYDLAKEEQDGQRQRLS